jgi:DNA-directed RNA polymerase subunit RPC12/RpoP
MEKLTDFDFDQYSNNDVEEDKEPKSITCPECGYKWTV